MCGISVLFHKESITEERYIEFLKSMQLINHRGPDDEGIVLINTNTGDYIVTRSQIENINLLPSSQTCSFNLALGHKRLSIIDLSANGHQPMKGKDGSWLVFNGEIYNYIEVREELRKSGCVFKTNSDTEVILEAYRTWGKNCLHRFNGMWSFFLWDAQTKQFFISNDRFGVKPLYYKEDANGFMLVSETKQLKAYKNITLSINENSLKNFIDGGYTDTDENTIYNNVFRFKKAHCICIEPKSYQINLIQKTQERYYQINQKRVSIYEREAIKKFRELLYDAVRLRMRADVNFGFAISGGIDSSAILHMARHVIQEENSQNELIGFSAIFPGYEKADESKYIKIVANDLPCQTIYCNPLEDFSIDTFEQHVYYQDEPLSGTSFLAQWNVYQKVQKNNIKILFNGQGADEVFAGYHHHFYRYCRQLLMKGDLPQYFTLVNQYAEIKGVKTDNIHRIVFNEIKLRTKMLLGIAKFDNVLAKNWNRISTLDEMLLADFNVFQLPTYLRVDDRNSMAHSIESRHPFMDYRLVEFGYSLPFNLLIQNGWQKYIIRQAMREMPSEIKFRKDKKGFTTPEDDWLNKYKNEFENYLSYNKSVLGKKNVTSEKYKNYSLGAWLKVNQL